MYIGADAKSARHLTLGGGVIWSPPCMTRMGAAKTAAVLIQAARSGQVGPGAWCVWLELKSAITSPLRTILGSAQGTMALPERG